MRFGAGIYIGALVLVILAVLAILHVLHFSVSFGVG